MSLSFTIEKTGLKFYQTTLSWPKTHANALLHFTEANLAQAVRKAIADARGHGFFAATDAAEKLAKGLPGEPQTTLQFQGQFGPNNGGELESDPLSLSTRAGCPGRQYSILSIPGKWDEFHLSDHLPQRPERLSAAYRFKVSSFAEMGCEHEDIRVHVKRILNAIEAHLAPIIKMQPAVSLDDLAALCAAAITQIQHPIAGLLHFSSVRVTLRAVANGVTVKQAKATAAPGRKSMTQNAQASTKFGSESTASDDRIFVALGSNVGDRFAAIESACRHIDEDPDMRIVATSSLFETEPMYVEDQERFLNGVCQVRLPSGVRTPL